MLLDIQGKMPPTSEEESSPTIEIKFHRCLGAEIPDTREASHKQDMAPGACITRIRHPTLSHLKVIWRQHNLN